MNCDGSNTEGVWPRLDSGWPEAKMRSMLKGKGEPMVMDN